MPVTPSDLDTTLVVHDDLNPVLWDGDTMRLSVRVALLKAALAFAEFIDLKELKVDDVILTGSSASFNYTEFSDLDVHLIVSYEDTLGHELAENFFGTKKSLWNETHQITVKGYTVEMYVEDSADPVKALGVYSLLKGKWVKKPTMDEKPEWNDHAVAAKVDSLAETIDTILSKDDLTAEDIDTLIERIRKMRKAGLAERGEFSAENLAFKGLRNLGYMDRLYQARMKAEDDALSLESAGQT